MTELTLAEYDKLIQKHGSGRKAAASLGIARTTFQDGYARAKRDVFVAKQHVNTTYIQEKRGRPQYFIVTSAQDSTKVHEGFMDNLEAYADEIGAELFVSGFTYNKTLFEDHGKNGSVFHPRVQPYIRNDRIKIGEELTVCCEMNTLPTAVNPLSGFHNYTGMRSGIFPHPKVQLESVPTMKGEPAKMLMTTGAVTQPNYVPKKAGIKAEFHHILGAVIIELKTDGTFFARHLIADSEGSFYDLDRLVKNKTVTKGHRAEGLTLGDIHRNKLDPLITLGTWGWRIARDIFHGEGEAQNLILNSPNFKSLVERTDPAHTFFEDVLDFEVRNHHNIGDAFFRYKQHHVGETVEEEIDKVVQFLTATMREGRTNVIVESNHDLALEKWLKTADWKYDPANAQFFIRGVLKLLVNCDKPNYSVFYDFLEEKLGEYDTSTLMMLGKDESYKIGVWDKGGIECGLHGHLGLNGARPSPKAFTKLGTRVNSAHTHSASIYEGVYTAGLSARLDHTYNSGPSSWSHSHILTYANVKRTIITMDASGRYTTLD